MAAQDEQHLLSYPYDRRPMESNNYNDLVNKPKINGVTVMGDKTLEDYGITVPTKTSELTNDSGFITDEDVPTKTSELTNDSDFTTKTYVDDEISALETSLEPIDGMLTIKNLLLTETFTSTFDNLATTLTTTLSTLKAALTANQMIEIKALNIATIGTVRPSSTILIAPSTDVLSLSIGWQGVTYNNDVLSAIDIVNKKVLSLTMTNDLNNDTFVSYFNDSTAYSFTLEYSKYETVTL